MKDIIDNHRSREELKSEIDSTIRESEQSWESSIKLIYRIKYVLSKFLYDNDELVDKYEEDLKQKKSVL